MASVPSRIVPRALARRRAVEVLTLAGTSLAFLFALAIAFGLVSG